MRILSIPDARPARPMGDLTDMPDLTDFTGSAADVTASIQQTAAGIPLWGWIIGGVLLVWFWTGHRGKRRALRQLDQEYEQKRKRIIEEHSSGARVRKAGSAVRRRIPKLRFS